MTTWASVSRPWVEHSATSLGAVRATAGCARDRYREKTWVSARPLRLALGRGLTTVTATAGTALSWPPPAGRGGRGQFGRRGRVGRRGRLDPRRGGEGLLSALVEGSRSGLSSKSETSSKVRAAGTGGISERSGQLPRLKSLIF